MNFLLNQLEISIDDLIAELRRRGPDSLGWKKVALHSKTSNSVEEQEVVSGSENDCLSSVGGGAELFFIGATLQLRGVNPIIQPLVDSACNILVYNGKDVWHIT